MFWLAQEQLLALFEGEGCEAYRNNYIWRFLRATVLQYVLFIVLLTLGAMYSDGRFFGDKDELPYAQRALIISMRFPLSFHGRVFTLRLPRGTSLKTLAVACVTPMRYAVTTLLSGPQHEFGRFSTRSLEPGSRRKYRQRNTKVYLPI